MERDAQIRQTAAEWLRYNHPTCTQVLVEAFRCGAEWADKHPTNPWKDASVEKPPYDIDCDDETSVYVIVRQEQGNVLEAYYDYDNNDWRDRDHNWRLQDPTHWMPIPELKMEE